MSSNLSAYTASGYTSAVALGRGIGLRLALETITAEINRQTDLAATADTFHSAARHQHTRARLCEVATVVGGYFRQ
jgi:hypothetical protein